MQLFGKWMARGPGQATQLLISWAQGCGPKTGSNRAQNTANCLGDSCVVSCFFNVLIGAYGVLIIPKWLKFDSWSIPILYGWFWELLKFSIFWTRSDPRTPYFSWIYLLQKIQEKSGNILGKILSMEIWELKFSKFSKFWKPWVSNFWIFEI